MHKKQRQYNDRHSQARDLTVGEKSWQETFKLDLVGCVVRQSVPLTYLITVREKQIWKWHIDRLCQRDNTPKELLKSVNRLDSERGLVENEFDNMPVTDDDYMPGASSETTSSEQTETRHCPERTH